MARDHSLLISRDTTGLAYKNDLEEQHNHIAHVVAQIAKQADPYIHELKEQAVVEMEGL